MGFFDDATREAEQRLNSTAGDSEDATKPASTSVDIEGRAAETTVAGAEVSVSEPDTQQSDDGTWLTGTEQYGWPRGREALEARQIQQTWPMELIANGINDQLMGGEVAFESEEETLNSAASDLQTLLRDVITGPHLMDDDVDDLIAAAVADMLGPGNAYWQLLPSEDGSVPVVSLVPLDALTVRHNSNRHGYPQDPPYFQASGAFSGDGVGTLGNITPTELQRGDLAVMRYPGARRSYQVYPKSPCMQIRNTLELLANSTTHHNRFYNDDEIPAGFIQVMNASDNTVKDLEDKIQAAAGDPRSVEVIGGEGAAQWIEMGGTAINLSVIEEQKWFLQLCLAAVGLGKAEIGMIEDVNRSNGEVEQSRVFKRVTGPFAKQFNGAFKHIAEQFDVYNALDQPFVPKLRFSDPSEERAREERLRQQYQSGVITYNEFKTRTGTDPGDLDTTVEIVDGVEIDYGDKPKPIVESLMIARRMDAMNADDGGDAEETAEEMSAAFDPPDEDDE